MVWVFGSGRARTGRFRIATTLDANILTLAVQVRRRKLLPNNVRNIGESNKPGFNEVFVLRFLCQLVERQAEAAGIGCKKRFKSAVLHKFDRKASDRIVSDRAPSARDAVAAFDHKLDVKHFADVAEARRDGICRTFIAFGEYLSAPGCGTSPVT